MEVIDLKNCYCMSCLIKPDERILRRYDIQSFQSLISFKQTDIFLCNLCVRIANRLDLFVQNVHRNQSLLNSNNVCQPLITLSMTKLESIDIIVNGDSLWTHSSIKQEENPSPDTVKEDGKYINQEGESPSSDDDWSRNSQDENCLLKHSKKKIQKNVGYTKYCLSENEIVKEREHKLLDAKYLKYPHKCSTCIISFSNQLVFTQHMKLHEQSDLRPYQCDICKVCVSAHYLKTHIRKHSERFKCNTCGVVLNSQTTIHDHINSVHSDGENIYNCTRPMCGKTFKRQECLRRHLNNVHNEKKEKTCMFCKKTYKHLNQHLVLQHPEEVSANVKKKTHICQVCEGSFRTAQNLKIHMSKHSDRRDFYCVECDKKFKTKQILRNHFLSPPHVSKDDYPFACTHCERRFPRSSLLTAHMNEVQGSKDFKCDHCGKAFHYHSMLRRHITEKHDDSYDPRKFKCDVCDKMFSRKYLLQKHYVTHTGERPFKCKVCPSAFTQSGSLLTHMRLIHLGLKRKIRNK